MFISDIAVVTSSALVKNAGITTITQSFFGNLFPIFDLASTSFDIKELDNFKTVLFSGFDHTFVSLTRHLKSIGKKIAVFWHFSNACEVDSDIGNSWRALLPFFSDKSINLFLTCKKGLDKTISQLFNVNSFFVMNNSMEANFRNLPKSGLGIFSGSSNYWAKNIYSNLYACLLTNRSIDVLPYDDTLKSIVQTSGKDYLVTGTTEKLEYYSFLERLSRCELISYISFTEGAPLIPLEALNNGVICLSGNNHHYFENDPWLHSFLVISRMDDSLFIYHSIERALQYKREILQHYTAWKEHYDILQCSNFNHMISLLASL